MVGACGVLRKISRRAWVGVAGICGGVTSNVVMVCGPGV